MDGYFGGSGSHIVKEVTTIYLLDIGPDVRSSPFLNSSYFACSIQHWPTYIYFNLKLKKNQHWPTKPNSHYLLKKLREILSHFIFTINITRTSKLLTVK